MLINTARRRLVLASAILVVTVSATVSGALALFRNPTSLRHASEQTRYYGSTSTLGDYMDWTSTSHADGTLALSAVWTETDLSGFTAKTITFSADCGVPDPIFQNRPCTYTSSQCTGGTSACILTGTPNDNLSGGFGAIEVPGLALYAGTQGTDTQGNPIIQMNVGYARDPNACVDATGDYSYIKLTGSAQTADLFGIYHSNADFSSYNHADFNMSAADKDATPTIGYSSASASETVGGLNCTNGVRIGTSNNGNKIVRNLTSPNGMSIVDLPSGQGGMAGFKTTNAAAIADLANLNMFGLVLGGPYFIRPEVMQTGALNGNVVPIKYAWIEDPSQHGQTGLAIEPLSVADLLTTGTPALPDYTASVSGYTGTLAASYPNPSYIPGLFKVTGNFSDQGRVILAASKVNGAVTIVGVVYSWNGGSSQLQNLANIVLSQQAAAPPVCSYQDAISPSHCGCSVQFPVDISGVVSLYPFGVHANYDPTQPNSVGGHPEGHRGIDPSSYTQLVVNSPLDGVVISTSNSQDAGGTSGGEFDLGPGSPSHFTTIMGDCGMKVKLIPVDLDSGIVAGTRVLKGHPIGVLSKIKNSNPAIYDTHFELDPSDGFDEPAYFAACPAQILSNPQEVADLNSVLSSAHTQGLQPGGTVELFPGYPESLDRNPASIVCEGGSLPIRLSITFQKTNSVTRG